MAKSAKRRRQVELGRFDKTSSEQEPDATSEEDDFMVLLARSLFAQWPEWQAEEEYDESDGELQSCNIAVGI